MLSSRIQIDQNSPTPVYRQIAEGVREAATEGHLLPGHRLPPTRDLARQLGVNRQTVVSAYEHLAAEGWVESHTGKGTFLADADPRSQGAAVSTAGAGGPAEGWLSSFSRAVEAPNVRGLLTVYQVATADAGIPFAGSYPARELMPVDEFRDAMAATLNEDAARLLTYGPTAGYPPLREAIARRMCARGSAVGANDVLVTNGAQQAIELVLHSLLERGDTVLIEEPTYTGVLSVLGSIGARVVTVPVDDQGLRPDLLAIALERHRPRVMYVQPTFHNPTSAVMGEARRREVLALAARNRCLVLEDDWGSGLRFEGVEPPTLHALDGGDRVIYVSTFSKKLLPGLRVGWVAASPRVMERLVALKQIRDCGTSPLLQAALCRFLEDGSLEIHLGRVLPAYRMRRDTMLRALERHFPRSVRWTRPQGGLFLWVELPRDIDGDGLFRAAEERGVRYTNGNVFHGHVDGRHTLRLTYSTATPAEIESGVAILGELIRQRWPDRSDPGGRRAAQAMPIV